MGRVGRHHGDMWRKKKKKDKEQFKKRRNMGRKRKASMLHEHWIPCFGESTRGVKEDRMYGPARQHFRVRERSGERE